MKHLIHTIIAALCAVSALCVSGKPKNPLRTDDQTFFTSDEARRIGDQLLVFQRVTGGWQKNTDMWTPLSDEMKAEVLAQKTRTDDSTVDNNATTTQMTFLARLFDATPDVRYAESFAKGLDYLLQGQYDNGGWPQFWPNPQGYQVHITYNDNAMANILTMLRDIAAGEFPYTDRLIADSVRQRAAAAFDRGIECILRTQIMADGKPTVWCQQHYLDTFMPAPARSYELPSYCSLESVALVKLLMELPEPDDRVKAAVNGAMEWFEANRIPGKKYVFGNKADPESLSMLVDDPDGPGVWARYYDLENCKPYVCDRDGIPQDSLDKIGRERRNGYGWYNSAPAALFPAYAAWKATHE